FGFNVLHGTAFKSRSGEFADWPDEKFPAVHKALGDLAEKHTTETITGTLKYSVYKQHFVDVRPPKMHQTSQYGLLFSGVLNTLIQTIIRAGGRNRLSDNRLSVVVESGHPNASD